MSCDQRLGARAEADPHADDLLARLATMPASRLEVRTKGQSLLRDVRKVARSGSDYFDDVAIRPLLGESEILDMDQHVSVENAAKLFLVGGNADEMCLAWRPPPAFDGLAEMSDFAGEIPLTLLIRRAPLIGFDRNKGIQGEPCLPG